MADVTFRLLSPAGDAVDAASLLVAYPNGTYRTRVSNRLGDCLIDLYRTDQEVLVLAAAKGHRTLREKTVPGASSLIELSLKPSPDRLNGALFTRSSGSIPGIEGELKPEVDGDRTVVYADNIAINGRVANPAPFEIGEPLHLIDAFGMETQLTFREVTPRFSLIEYTEPRPYGARP